MSLAYYSLPLGCPTSLAAETFASSKGNAMAAAAPKEPVSPLMPPCIYTRASAHQQHPPTKLSRSSKGKQMAFFGKGGKGKPVSQKELEEILADKYYDDSLKNINNECEFSYEVNQILMEINKKRGAMQAKPPSKEVIKEEFKKWDKSKERSADLRAFLKSLMSQSESFSVGKSAVQAVMCIFGAPISALLLKKVVPGGGKVSDDIVLPAVTSLTVLLLATTNRL